jgi:glycosyltransferase involved in cell wall biosynthesis
MSLVNDWWGILLLLWYRLFPKRPLRPVSICTGIYNRSDNYLNQFLPSVLKAQHRELIELSVVDCHSTDIDNLEAAIQSNWKGSLLFNTTQKPFSRSTIFNKAVSQASHSIVFICDADMSVPENIVELCNNYTGKRRVWYPIIYFLFKDKPAKIGQGNGVWEEYSAKGMVACLKENFKAIGGINEQYTSWGAEDYELWERFYQNGFVVISNKQKGMFHHWHTTLNKKYAHLN